MRPLVSIVTPTYNHAQCIGECIQSVLGQSYPHWEMLVADDGSTDATPEIVKSFRDPRIRYFRQENRGIARLAQTYNDALARARGELIAVLEGDDFWPGDKLEKQVPAFENPETVLSYGMAQKMVEDRVQGMVKCGYGRWPEASLNNDPAGAILPMLLSLDGHQPPAVTVMARKQALERIGGFQSVEELPLVDYPTWLCLALEGRFAFVPQVLGFWRRHPAQAMKNQALQIQAGVSRYAGEFYRARVPEGLKRRYGMTQRWMNKNLAFGMGWGHFQEGRFHLVDGDWRGARKSFWTGLSFKSARIRALSALGLAASLVRADLEPLARVAGKAYYARGGSR